MQNRRRQKNRETDYETECRTKEHALKKTHSSSIPTSEMINPKPINRRREKTDRWIVRKIKDRPTDYRQTDRQKTTSMKKITLEENVTKPEYQFLS